MSRHIIKYEFEDGKKLEIPTLWCGIENKGHSFVFLSAQHAALASGGSIPQCKNCVKAIIKQLSKEL